MKQLSILATKTLAVCGLVALGVALSSPISAADRQYCQQSGSGVWSCSSQCPPLGCNCDCAENCYEVSCS